MTDPLTYKSTGVDIANADATKAGFGDLLKTDDKRVLNNVGAFASLFRADFPGIEDPVLVMKTEEPGSKQKLAVERKMYESIAEDTINHLTNDVIVMGATPLFAQNCIVCGKIEKDAVSRLVKGFAHACRMQECSLTGGETSEQPGIVPVGMYVLTASMVGVVERSKIIDGSSIKKGDIVMALASNGLHTNGYTLVRKLLEQDSALAEKSVDQGTFLSAVLTPHRCYYKCLKEHFGSKDLHGLAHITGGGIQGNLNRILPKTLNAQIDCATMKIPTVFCVIREAGNIEDSEMLQTYNMGVGIAAVVSPHAVEEFAKSIQAHSIDCYPIGEIVSGDGSVEMTNTLPW